MRREEFQIAAPGRNSCPVLFRPFGSFPRVGQIVGRTKTPKIKSAKKLHKNRENPPKLYSFGGPMSFVDKKDAAEKPCGQYLNDYLHLRLQKGYAQLWFVSERLTQLKFSMKSSILKELVEDALYSGSSRKEPNNAFLIFSSNSGFDLNGTSFRMNIFLYKADRIIAIEV